MKSYQEYCDRRFHDSTIQIFIRLRLSIRCVNPLIGLRVISTCCPIPWVIRLLVWIKLYSRCARINRFTVLCNFIYVCVCVCARVCNVYSKINDLFIFDTQWSVCVMNSIIKRLSIRNFDSVFIYIYIFYHIREKAKSKSEWKKIWGEKNYIEKNILKNQGLKIFYFWFDSIANFFKCLNLQVRISFHFVTLFTIQ